MTRAFLAAWLAACGGGGGGRHAPSDAGGDASAADAGPDAGDAGFDAGPDCTGDADCGANARCVGEVCVCDAPFIGDGHVCEALWTAVAIDSASACGIRDEGTLWCWGATPLVDLEDHGRPTQVGSESTWTDVATGTSHDCGVSGGRAFCWGDDDYGQIGDGTFGTPRLTPVNVSGLASGVSGVAAVGGLIR